MTWGRLDDKLHAHPKAEKADLEAMGLWAMALSYCCDQLTDGHITAARVAMLARGVKRGSKLASRLVEVGFWHPINARCPADHPGCERYLIEGADGFRFHDWEDWGPDRLRVLDERLKRSLAGRQGGLSKASKNLAKPLALASGLLDTSPLPLIRSVSDPDPKREEPPTGVQGGGAVKGQAKKPRAKPAPLADLSPDDLSPAERRVLEIIAADPSLAPICQSPARLAQDLVLMAPLVDVALELRGLAAHTRKPGKRYTDGNAYLQNNIRRKQNEAAALGLPAPAPEAPRPKFCPPPPPTALPAHLADFKRPPAWGQLVRPELLGLPPEESP